MRTIQLQGVDNVRDYGGWPTTDGLDIKEGLFFRGSALANATAQDCKTLFDELGIACVVDLRCGWELEAKPDIEHPGIEYYHIPFYDQEIVGIDYTARAKGTIAIGHDVACNPEHFYRSLANPLTVGQMRKGIDAVFSHVLQGLPVYVHCSGGKDRAGILTLLVLTILGASREDILGDYLYTNVSRDKNYPKMFESFLKLAAGNVTLAHELVESHRARAENIDAFWDAIADQYGSAESFVREQLGFDDDRIVLVRNRCTA